MFFLAHLQPLLISTTEARFLQITLEFFFQYVYCIRTTKTFIFMFSRGKTKIETLARSGLRIKSLHSIQMRKNSKQKKFHILVRFKQCLLMQKNDIKTSNVFCFTTSPNGFQRQSQRQSACQETFIKMMSFVSKVTCELLLREQESKKNPRLTCL